MSQSIKDNLDFINQFLQPVRARVEKEAAADNSVSFQDSPDNRIEEHETPKADDATTSQRNVGLEQTQEAKAGSSNVDSVEANSNPDGDSPVDDQGPKTLDIDEEVTGKGNIGPMREQIINQEQKTAADIARAERLGNSILKQLKQAAAADPQSDAEPMQPGTVPAAPAGDTSKTDYTAPAGEVDKQAADAAGEGVAAEGVAPEAEGEVDKEAAAAFDSAAAVSAQFAQQVYEAHLLGQFKRAQDEMETTAAGINPDVLQKVGGVEGLLDKVAMETPEAVLPEGAAVEGAGEVLPGAGEVMPGAAEAMPPAGGDMLGGDEPAPEELDALAAELDAAGVTPEDIEQALTDAQVLEQSGVAPDELAQALTEMGGEAEGGLPEAEMVKAASYQGPQRARIDAVKEYLRG